MARDNNVTMEGVRLIFRNFTGKAGLYNREGDRSFGVLLSHEDADQMQRDGWNVKYLKAREEGDVEQPWLEVSVNFDGKYPPRVVMISSRGRTNMTEETVGGLDWAEFETVDLIISPYTWTVQDKTGIKAYLHAIYATIIEDELEMKYADVVDAPGRGLSEIETE